MKNGVSPTKLWKITPHQDGLYVTRVDIIFLLMIKYF